MKNVGRGYVWAVCMMVFLLTAAGTVKAAYTGDGQKTLILKSGSEGPPNELGTQGAARFAELMKQRTNGKIQITHYPDSQLGKWQQMLESVKTGSLAIVYTPAGGSEDFYMMLYPYVFRDSEHAAKILQGSIREDWSKKHMEKTGIYIFGGLNAGFQHCIFAKAPVRTPADMKGMKFRVPQDKIFVETFQALGARPTPIALGELYLALRQGVADGAAGLLDVFINFNMYDVSKYLVLTGHMFQPLWAHMNGQLWQNLTPETKKVWLDAWKEVAAWAEKEGKDREAKNIALWKSKGGIIVEPDVKAFRESTKDVWKKLVTRPEEKEAYEKIQAVQ
ncbi:MAG TPA: TRAP transporter substrate-binding protein [Syntrophorhabdaceae bacterium]|nr:TRAP transporter substrate-binding protein [Syntrophorhabdaceae bacterium]